MLVDCFKIGPKQKVKYEPTGEVTDYMYVETTEDVFLGGSVDLSLRVQQRVLRQVDQRRADCEETISSLGGIGFFMGGI